MVNDAIADSQVLELSYYKENEDELTTAGSSPTGSRTVARAGTSSATT